MSDDLREKLRAAGWIVEAEPPEPGGLWRARAAEGRALRLLRPVPAGVILPEDTAWPEGCPPPVARFLAGGAPWAAWAPPQGSSLARAAEPAAFDALNTLLDAVHALGWSHGALRPEQVGWAPAAGAGAGLTVPGLSVPGLLPTPAGLRSDRAALLAWSSPAPRRLPAEDNAQQTDPTPAAPLRPEAGGGDGAHTAVAAALVTDPEGRGHVVELLVQLLPGEGGVEALGAVERDAEVAAQVAVAAALGPEAGRYRARWQLRGAPSLRLGGASLGLALYAATRAAAAGRRLPTGLAFTGGVDLDGRVVPVGGMAAKLRAASAAGLRLYRPVDRAAPEGGVPIGHVRALEPLFGQRWRRALPSLALLLPSLLSAAGATEIIEGPPRAWASALLRPEMSVEDVIVAPLPAGVDRRSLRPRYADWRRSLAERGAEVVVIDVDFGEDEVEGLGDAAKSEGEGKGEGERVGVGKDALGAGLPPVARAARPSSRAWRDAAAEGPRFGLPESHHDLLFGVVRRFPVRFVAEDGAVLWHLAVQAAALRNRVEPRIDGDALRLGPLRAGLWAETARLPPAGPVPRTSLDGDERLDGKVVIIGALDDDRDLHRTAEGSRAGAEVLAIEIQALLSQATPRPLPRSLAAALPLLVGPPTALLRRRGGGRLLTLLPLVTGLIAAAALLSGGGLPALWPLLLAAAVGFWLGARGAPLST